MAQKCPVPSKVLTGDNYSHLFGKNQQTFRFFCKNIGSSEHLQKIVLYWGSYEEMAI